MRGGIALLAVFAVVLAGCGNDGKISPFPMDTSDAERTMLSKAVQRTREAGGARTTSTLPEGVMPTIRVSGVVDFAAGRSDTMLDVEKDGRRIHYQRLVRGPEGVFLGRYLVEDQSEPRWQRIGDLASEPPGFGVHIDGISLLAAVETQDPHLVPAEDSGMRFERVEPVSMPEPAVWIHVVELDGQGRVHRVEFELASLDGRHSLTYSDYGEAPPVRVPTPDV